MTDAAIREPTEARPSSTPFPARFAVLAAAAFAVLVPLIQSMGDFGLSASEFSRQGDRTLRAESYAFSIWSLIYAGLLAAGVYLARVSPTALRRGAVWPSTLAILSCGLWIIASSADLRWLSVAIILTGAFTASAVILRRRHEPSRFDQIFIFWPMALLAGWLTIASALNILTVMTAEGLVPPARADDFAIAGLAAVTVCGIGVGLRSRCAVYLVPIVWGLIAVVYAEGDRGSVAMSAAVAALMLAVVGSTLLFRSMLVRSH